MPEWLPTDDPRLSRVKQKRGARRRVLGWDLSESNLYGDLGREGDQ